MLMGLRRSGRGGEDSEGYVGCSDGSILQREMERTHIFLVMRR